MDDSTEAAEAQAPWTGLGLAYAAVAPVLIGGATVLAAPEMWILRLTILWAGAFLCFLGGVRRGLSFRQPGGPASIQIGGALGLFAFGVVARAVPMPIVSVVILILGHIAAMLLDPLAARQGEAPQYFAQLRPPQIGVALLGLALLLLRLTLGW